MRLSMEFHALTFLLFVTVSQSQLPMDPDLPDPRILITGPTGSGKSSLANALLGCDPKSSDCMFRVCDGMDSCTKETTYGTGQWLGKGQNFTVVDSPGFQDSDGEDDVLIEEMLDVLKNTIKHSTTILLVLKGTETRFNEGLKVMLTQMNMIFGDQWWDYTVIGVSFWKLDQASIDEREGTCEHYPDKCKDEQWFIREINNQLQEKFHVKRNLTFAFIDSYSQAWPDNEDPVQQQHFNEEAGILWEETIARNTTLFFKGIDDVLEENAAMKEKIRWLEDVITKNISELISRMEANEENDETQDETIARNEDKASTERNLLRLDVIKNNDTIIKVRQDLSDDLSKVSQEIIDYMSKVSQDLTEVTEDLIPGIGTIVPWIPSPDGPNGVALGKIPHGWQRCDGSQITSGPLINLKTPDLNGQGLFLRGGEDISVTTVQEAMVLDHSHKDNGHSHLDSGHSHTQKSHSHGTHGNIPVLNEPGSSETTMYLNANNRDGYDYYAHQGYGTESAIPTINSANASIKPAKSNVTTVADSDDYNSGKENRPKNMIVTYIMRIL